MCVHIYVHYVRRSFLFSSSSLEKSHLVGADPGLDEGGDILGHPRDEAVGLVVHQVELLGHLLVAVIVVAAAAAAAVLW